MRLGILDATPTSTVYFHQLHVKKDDKWSSYEPKKRFKKYFLAYFSLFLHLKMKSQIVLDLNIEKCKHGASLKLKLTVNLIDYK